MAGVRRATGERTSWTSPSACDEERTERSPSGGCSSPKPDGRQRPLGVTTLEDKLVQRALVTVLNCIYEVDFLGFSYGFRPGRSPHDALDALYVGITKRKVNWVLDADIRGFFDAIDHEWLVKFIEHRIADRRVVRLIQKWLNAGVLEDGEWRRSEEGTPQGGSISPLLANVYLHYVFDLWVREWRRQAHGRRDRRPLCRRHHRGLPARVGSQAVLGRAARATRGVRAGAAPREDPPDRVRPPCGGEPKAERTGQARDVRLPRLHAHLREDAERTLRGLAADACVRGCERKLQEVKDELRWRWHDPVPEVGKWLASIIRGHFNYYAVPLNFAAVEAFRHQVIWLWQRALSRRSQQGQVTWERMRRIADAGCLPSASCTPGPTQRLCLLT